MMPNPYYMENQAEIQWSMRSVLIDWVVQVHGRFTMLPETLFLAVNCIDRFLTVKVVSIAKLQLVGATAIYVAAKYEEINCPSVQEVAFMVDGSYTQEEILKAERFMLTMLKFELGWPGPLSFLRRISKADEYDVDTRTVAKYFLEVTLMDERFVGCTPSFLAAGTHCLARLMLRKGDWVCPSLTSASILTKMQSQGHIHYSGYTFAQLRPLLAVILECLASPAVHHPAVYEKYMARNLKRVSQYVKGEVDCGFKLPGAKRESAAAGAWANLRAGDASRRKWDGRAEENLRPACAV
jgi:G2/mitotic-specific cyclin 3/4